MATDKLREIAEQLVGEDNCDMSCVESQRLIVERAMRLAIEATVTAPTFGRPVPADEQIAARMAELLKAEAKR